MEPLIVILVIAAAAGYLGYLGCRRWRRRGGGCGSAKPARKRVPLTVEGKSARR